MATVSIYPIWLFLFLALVVGMVKRNDENDSSRIPFLRIVQQWFITDEELSAHKRAKWHHNGHVQLLGSQADEIHHTEQHSQLVDDVRNLRTQVPAFQWHISLQLISSTHDWNPCNSNQSLPVVVRHAVQKVPGAAMVCRQHMNLI